MSKLIIYIIVSLFSTFGFSYLYYIFNVKPKFKVFRASIVFVFGGIFLALLRYNNFLVISSISFFLFFPIMYYCIYYQSIKKLFFYLIIIWIYGMFLDLLSMIVVSLLYSIFGFNVNSNYIFQVLPTVIISCLLILSGHIPFFKKAIEFLYKKIQKVEYLDIILFIFSAFVLTLSITLAFNIENLKINLLLVLVLFLMFMLFIVLIKYKLNAVENEIFLKTLKANNDFYISMNDENRIFRHNLMAKLLSIKSVSNRKARVLIDDLLTEFNSSLDFSKHIKDIPYGLNGI